MDNLDKCAIETLHNLYEISNSQYNKQDGNILYPFIIKLLKYSLINPYNMIRDKDIRFRLLNKLSFVINDNIDENKKLRVADNVLRGTGYEVCRKIKHDN